MACFNLAVQSTEFFLAELQRAGDLLNGMKTPT